MKLYMKFLLLTFLSATVVHAERGLKVQNSLNSVEIQNLNIGKKHAIIIGINSYKNGINPLKTAVNDAKEVQKILKETYGFETILITDETATKDFILLSIENIAKNAKPNDQIVIYYGGHGYFEKQTNTSYWMPSDATSTSFVKGIKSKDITDILKMSQSKQILVVADSCYSGTMDRDSSMQWKSTNDTRANFLQKQLRDVSRILLSSGGNEPVSDGYGKHSVFANYFLKKLKEFEKDVFTAEELYGSYKEAIGGNSEQIPQYKSILASGHEGGDFIFVKKISSKPVEQIVKVEQVTKPIVEVKPQVITQPIVQEVIKIEPVVKSVVVQEVIKPVIPKEVVVIDGLWYQNQPFTKEYKWEDAKAYCNNLTLGGASDWRLPEKEELNKISNIKMYGVYDDNWSKWFDNNKHKRIKNSKGYEHFIRKEFSENMPFFAWFWSITEYNNNSSYAWYVYFYDGRDNWFGKSYECYALCVRGQ